MQSRLAPAAAALAQKAAATVPGTFLLLYLMGKPEPLLLARSPGQEVPNQAVSPRAISPADACFLLLLPGWRRLVWPHMRLIVSDGVAGRDV